MSIQYNDQECVIPVRRSCWEIKAEAISVWGPYGIEPLTNDNIIPSAKDKISAVKPKVYYYCIHSPYDIIVRL